MMLRQPCTKTAGVVGNRWHLILRATRMQDLCSTAQTMYQSGQYLPDLLPNGVTSCDSGDTPKGELEFPCCDSCCRKV